VPRRLFARSVNAGSGARSRCGVGDHQRPRCLPEAARRRHLVL